MTQPAQEREGDQRDTILVGVANPETLPNLIGIAKLLAKQAEGDIVAVAVITVPPQLPLQAAESGDKAAAAERLVAEAVSHAEQIGARARGIVEVTREVHEGLLDAAEREDARVIVLGFSPLGAAGKRTERDFDRITDRVSAGSKVPVLIAKLAPGREIAEIRSVLVPMEKRLDVGICADLLHAGRTAGWEFTFLARAPTHADAGQVQEVRSRAAAAIAQAALHDLGELQVRRADNALALAVQLAPEFDATVLGAPAETVSEWLLSSVAERIAHGSPNTVCLVRNP